MQKKEILPTFCIPLKTGVDNSKMIKDVEIFPILNTDIATHNDIPPMPDKLPGDFFEFISKHYEF